MQNINSFLGFTDAIKEPRKTKVEDTLTKAIRDNTGTIYNRRTFLLNKLVEGRKPIKEENIITYNKRTCEQNKPKTEYRLIDTETYYFFELNKTEYDFCVYCIDNGFINIDTINTYITEEENRLQAIKQQQKENARIQAEKERAEQEEYNRIQTMIKSEVEKLPEEQTEIMNSIFLSMLGTEANANCYTLLVCINHFDNVVCKNEIISRLHNDNVASIKTFECITGLRLPKGYKERINYLNGITSNDFIGMVEYKERKKAEQKEIITEEFYINQRGNDGSIHWQKVIAEPYSKYDIDLFIMCVNGEYKMSEARTGSLIVYSRNKTECKQKLDTFIQEKGKEKVIDMINNFLVMIEEKAGKNPRYQLEQIA